MKKLSVYVDESGVFEPYDSSKPFYLFTLVFCEEEENSNNLVQLLIHELDLLNSGTLIFHGGPLIRKEKEFSETSIELRRKIFNKMTYFACHFSYSYKTFIVDRKQYYNETILSLALSNEFSVFLFENIEYFSNFDTIVYYDNGQKQLTKILKESFFSIVGNVVFKKVVSKESYLLQLADYLTTLELIEQKYLAKKISPNEIYFFGSHTNFRKNYYRQIENKKFTNK